MRWLLLLPLLGGAVLWWLGAERYVRWYLRHVTLNAVLGLILLGLCGLFLGWELAVVLSVIYIPIAIRAVVVTKRHHH
jgi:hypothetical protein